MVCPSPPLFAPLLSHSFSDTPTSKVPSFSFSAKSFNDSYACQPPWPYQFSHHEAHETLSPLRDVSTSQQKTVSRIAPSALKIGRPIFIQRQYGEELRSLSMKLPNPSPVLDKNRAPMGPEILSSAGARVWRKAPKAFPDYNSVLDKFQLALKITIFTFFLLCLGVAQTPPFVCWLRFSQGWGASKSSRSSGA